MATVAELARLNRDFAERVPYNLALGLTMDDLGPGEASMSLPFRSELVGCARTGVIHGGAVSALMDACAGACVCEGLLPICSA